MAKERAIFSLDVKLLEELRRCHDRYAVLARLAHVTSPVTMSGIVAEGLRRELDRRKVRTVIRRPLPAEVVNDARAVRHFREIMQIDLRAIDLDISIDLDAGQVCIDCPAFCQEAVEAVLGEVETTAIEEAVELAEGPGVGLSDEEVEDLIEQDRTAGEARRAREAENKKNGA